MPLEYHAEVLDGPVQQQALALRVAGLAAGVAVVAFLLLQAALGSWRLAGLVFLTLPLAGAGGALAAFAVGGAGTLGALMGGFTVLGLAARNGVVLAGELGRLEEVTADEVARVTRERAGPLVVTAAATAAVLLPPLVAGGGPGAEVLTPLCAVVLGGLVTSTAVALLALPALYLRLASPARREPVVATVAAS
jgi:Cu/Ag efflux pump CusA